MIYYGQKAKDVLAKNLNDANLFSKGYFKENYYWIAFDNYSGNCFVEEFSQEAMAVAWVENYFDMSEIDDFKISKVFGRYYYIKGKGVLIVNINDGKISTKLVRLPHVRLVIQYS